MDSGIRSSTNLAARATIGSRPCAAARVDQEISLGRGDGEQTTRELFDVGVCADKSRVARQANFKPCTTGVPRATKEMCSQNGTSTHHAGPPKAQHLSRSHHFLGSDPQPLVHKPFLPRTIQQSHAATPVLVMATTATEFEMDSGNKMQAPLTLPELK